MISCLGEPSMTSGQNLGSFRFCDSDDAILRSCPACDHPFDRYRRRRLVDQCGHERCFLCACTNTECPVCAVEVMIANCEKMNLDTSPSKAEPEKSTLGRLLRTNKKSGSVQKNTNSSKTTFSFRKSSSHSASAKASAPSTTTGGQHHEKEQTPPVRRLNDSDTQSSSIYGSSNSTISNMDSSMNRPVMSAVRLPSRPAPREPFTGNNGGNSMYYTFDLLRQRSEREQEPPAENSSNNPSLKPVPLRRKKGKAPPIPGSSHLGSHQTSINRLSTQYSNEDLYSDVLDLSGNEGHYHDSSRRNTTSLASFQSPPSADTAHHTLVSQLSLLLSSPDDNSSAFVLPARATSQSHISWRSRDQSNPDISMRRSLRHQTLSPDKSPRLKLMASTSAKDLLEKPMSPSRMNPIEFEDGTVVSASTNSDQASSYDVVSHSGVFGGSAGAMQHHHQHQHRSSQCSGLDNQHHHGLTGLTRSSNADKESLMSLMSSGSTSGIGHSNSPMTPHKMLRAPHQFRGIPSQSSRTSSVNDENDQLHLLQSKRNSGYNTNQNQQHKNGFKPDQNNLTASTVVTPVAFKSTNPDFSLDAMTFEVPWVDSEVFSGRDWVFHELHEILIKPTTSDASGVRGAVVHGGVGTGKSALLYQLAKASSLKSCLVSPCIPTADLRHNQSRIRVVNGGGVDNHTVSTDSGFNGGGSRLSLHQHQQQGNVSGVSQWCRLVGTHVVAFHFCQVDINKSCSLSEFLASIASQMANSAPLRGTYGDYLTKHPEVVDLLEEKSVLADPVVAFRKAIVDPLKSLHQKARSTSSVSHATPNCLILIDALEEAEYHRPESGESIGSFIVRHFVELPPFIRLVFSVKSIALDLVRSSSGVGLHRVNLDNLVMDERLYRDVNDFVISRIQSSPQIMANVVVNSGLPVNPNITTASNLRVHAAGTSNALTPAAPTAAANVESSNIQIQRLASHLTSLSKGNFLYLKLTLNLIERNHLRIKSTSYKVLPVNLSEVFLLLFNLKFPSVRAFENVSSILNICLASLYPLRAQEIYETVNAGCRMEAITWEQFCERLLSLSDFMTQRQDDTFVMFHPAFREWLIRRDDGESPKFLCDQNRWDFQVRQGHCLLALRLSRDFSRLAAQGLLELGHHMLKAHIYKQITREPAHPLSVASSRDCQAAWIALAAEDISTSLTVTKNVFCPNTKVSRLLLLAGASPNAKTTVFDGAPLLCVAARQGLMEFVQLLLEFGADINTSGEDGTTPLMHAAQAGHLDIVQHLHQHGSKLGQVDRRSWSALVHAATRGEREICSFLLQCDWTDPVTNGSSPPAVGNEARTSLVSNSSSLSLSNSSSALHSTPSSYAGSTYGQALKQQAAQQAFIQAAACGKTQVCQFFLDFGDAGLELPDPITDESALSLACANGQKETVQFLLTQGAKVSSAVGVDRPGSLKTLPSRTPPLFQAVYGGCWEVVSALLSKGVQVDRELNAENQTPLMAAAMQGHIGVMELLLSRDANVHAVDNHDRTALCWACIKDQVPCANLLLDRGAKPDHESSLGYTPLHYVAESAGKALVSLLLDRGAALERMNQAGLRPLDLAIKETNTEAVACFLKKGAKLGPTTWVLADGKSLILLMLLNKLLDDGNLLYKKERLKDSAQRYQYAIKKFPLDISGWKDEKTFVDLKQNLMLNFARCRRKQKEFTAAIELCAKVLELRPLTFEAFYVRSRCQRDMGDLPAAYNSITDAVRVCPANRDGQQMLFRLREEVKVMQQTQSSSNYQNARPDSVLSNTSGHTLEDRNTTNVASTSMLSSFNPTGTTSAQSDITSASLNSSLATVIANHQPLNVNVVMNGSTKANGVPVSYSSPPSIPYSGRRTQCPVSHEESNGSEDSGLPREFDRDSRGSVPSPAFRIAPLENTTSKKAVEHIMQSGEETLL